MSDNIWGSGPAPDDEPKTQIRMPGSPTAPQYGNPEYQPPADPYRAPQPGQSAHPAQPYGQPQQQGGYPPAGYGQPGAPEGYGQHPGYGQPVQQPGPPGGYASFGDRFVAYLWDWLYAWPGLVLTFLGFVMMIVGGGMAGSSAQSGGGGGAGTIVLLLGALLVFAGGLLSLWRQVKNFVLDQGKTGYTYGKRKVGIRTVNATTGQAPGNGPCLIRWLVYGALGFFSAVLVFFDDRNRSLSDMAASTLVINQPPA